MIETIQNLARLAAQFFLIPKPEWSEDDIPDLFGRVMIVTGGNTGIGKATVRALLLHNATVYMASRNEKKARAAIHDLRNETGREAIFLELDLADFTSVRAAASEFLSKEKELHVLFNNGGVMWPEVSEVSAQGYDLQFATNTMGHFLFTTLLIPALEEGAKTSPDKKVRVIHTSSAAIYMPGAGINFATLVDGRQRRSCRTNTLYNQSKCGNILVSNEMARRFEKRNIISISLNPGNIDSDLLRYTDPVVRYLSQKFILYSPSTGALTQLWAGLAPEGVHCNGQFLIPWARIGLPAPVTDDQELARKLWVWLEENTKVSSKVGK
ncbi:NAD(P)-binding protein [Hymenopellis radicata]|nr:NAD(P)-binding protein [Hymenopellis radicata]